MRPCLTVLAVALALFAKIATAEPVQMTAAEIRTLLSGNTAIGDWQGQPYRQSFRANGETIYAPKDSRSSAGKWRVNSQTNDFESWWPRSEWGSYTVWRDGEIRYWSGGGVERSEFTMIPGEHLLHE